MNSLKIEIDSYAYVLIKIAKLKQRIIDQETFERFRYIKNSNELLIQVSSFFPGIKSLKELNLVELENSMYRIYFQEYKKILDSSPRNMQIFLENVLIKYEIWNLKVILTGIIYNRPIEDTYKDIMIEPEAILNRIDIIKKLIEVTNIYDAEKLMKFTPYSKIIKEGREFYEKSGDLFLLESLLDKYYYVLLLENLKKYGKLEKEILNNYIEFQLLKYNLILIYRSKQNDIQDYIIKRLIINSNNLNIQKLVTQLVDYQKEEIESNIFKILKLFGISIKNIHKSTEKKSEKASELIKKAFSNHELDLLKNISKSHNFSLDSNTISQILYFLLNREQDIYRISELFLNIFHKLNKEDKKS